LVLFVASLIGIPPTAGFFGKFYIFRDALSADLVPLAIVLAVNSIVSIAYYLSIARAAFVDDEDSEAGSAPMNFGVVATCLLCAGGVVLAGIFGGPLMKWLVG
jgi:NADH-quinone oxidoreductase subunit N